MAFVSRSQEAFLKPDVHREDANEEEKASNSRHASVYDAVAGRISAAGFIPKHVVISSTRDTASSSTTAVAPEEVLFRRKNAPTRYAESDIYFASHRDSRTDIPDSDLLKALHCYTSDFYSRATIDSGVGDWRSLDETALIALGVLMEEMTRDILGETGDLVFTEGDEADGNSGNAFPGHEVRSRTQSVTSSIVDPVSKRNKGRHFKRRRLIEQNDKFD